MQYNSMYEENTMHHWRRHVKIIGSKIQILGAKCGKS